MSSLFTVYIVFEIDLISDWTNGVAVITSRLHDLL